MSAPNRAPRRLFIHTFGCQMNESDSARMAEILGRVGYVPTGEPEAADLILLNTCAIREKAEAKVLSALGRYRLIRNQRGTRLGVAGCVAQQEKEKLLERVRYLDFVIGPDQMTALPSVLARVEAGARVAETGWLESEEYVFPKADPESARGQVSAFVTVMKGCDNVCSFCVVPHTRGREVSRPYAEVVAEIGSLAQVGVREATLIGQNVNSYAGGCTFAELIRRVAAVPGMARIRFTTSHPQDLSPELMRAFAEVPALMPHFHLPVQSGSDSVLRRMRRNYGRDEYRGRVERLRALRPDIALTSDIIVGFPGESEEDFEATMSLVEEIGFENLYSFIYSPRPRTGAARHEAEWGAVPRDLAVNRLERLQRRQRDITLARNRSLVDRVVEVLVEGPSHQVPERRMGRSVWNHVVNFAGDAPAGAFARVRIDGATVPALAGTQTGWEAPPIAIGPRRRAALLPLLGAPA